MTNRTNRYHLLQGMADASYNFKACLKYTEIWGCFTVVKVCTSFSHAAQGILGGKLSKRLKSAFTWQIYPMIWGILW